MQLHAQPRLGTVSAWEPGIVFVLKSLLYPVSTVLVLGLCLLLFDRFPCEPYALIAVVAFVDTADLLEGVSWPEPRSGAWRRARGKLVPCWVLLVAFISAVIQLCDLAPLGYATALAA
jgi:hypothetical protein